MSDTKPSDSVVIERTFKAPTDRIWEMWTLPEPFPAWYGPTGATIPVAKMDVRVGGERLICREMQTPNGPMQMWFAGEYVEVVENEKLVSTEAMADENGTAVSGPGGPDPQGATEVTVELSVVDGGTRVEMTHAGIPAGSAGEAGWNMALDKLASAIA